VVSEEPSSSQGSTETVIEEPSLAPVSNNCVQTVSEEPSAAPVSKHRTWSFPVPAGRRLSRRNPSYRFQSCATRLYSRTAWL
ncbi:hypothetical protein BaRGS_00039338, partial [Batillaria attramentaria]